MKIVVGAIVGAVAIGGAILLSIPLALWAAFCVTPVWGWFITPVFGVPTPSLWMLAGVLLVARIPVVGLKSETDGKNGFEKLTYTLAFSVVWPPLTFVAGWIYHLFA